MVQYAPGAVVSLFSAVFRLIQGLLFDEYWGLFQSLSSAEFKNVWKIT
jgi:hypothetical protein